MKLCKSSFEIWEQPAGLEGVYKQIERVGRVCYKSEDKITEDSAKPFVDRMIKSGHGAMLEHGTVYLFIPLHCDKTDYHIAEWYHSNPYSRVKIRNEHYCFDSNGYYITTNLRVLVENNLTEHLKFICEPTEYHEKRITVHFVCDRGVSHEFVRHRVMSFAQESTRYCNYSKDKFGNELTFIIPCWMDGVEHYNECYGIPYNNECAIVRPLEEHREASIYYEYFYALRYAEGHYFRLLELGWKPQEARAVLPNSLKTELVMTGFVSDWKHFFELRCDSAAHPQARELAIPLREEFIKRNYI